MNKEEQVKVIREKLKLDDMADIESHIDSTLSLNENLQIIEDEYSVLIDEKASKNLQQEQLKVWQYQNKDPMDYSIINNITSLVVFGRRRTGKTAFVYHLLGSAKKPVYVFRHPTPQILSPLGYLSVYSLEDMERMHDCIIWIDEPDMFIPTYETKSNSILMKMLQIAAQRNITLILSTSNTRFVTRGLESFIDVYIIKDIETELVKQGSIAKKILKANAIISADGLRLYPHEFLFYARDYPQFEGKHTFELPSFWNDSYSKPFKIQNKTQKIIEKVKEKLC